MSSANAVVASTANARANTAANTATAVTAVAENLASKKTPIHTSKTNQNIRNIQQKQIATFQLNKQ